MALSKSQDWSSSCGSCFADLGTCCYVFWCTPCAFGQHVEKMEGGSCWGPCCIFYLLAMLGCPCFYSCGERKKLREKFNLPAAPCNDCILHCCCLACALCQESRELKSRNVHSYQDWCNAGAPVANPAYGYAAQPPQQQYMHQYGPGVQPQPGQHM